MSFVTVLCNKIGLVWTNINMGNALKKVAIPAIGLGGYWYRQERCQIHVKSKTEDEEVCVS